MRQLDTEPIPIVLMPGTRALRLERVAGHWRLWTATRDYKYGTFFLLYADGMCRRVTTRRDGDDDWMIVKPADVECDPL